jgi:hypothetical protein
MATTTRGIPYPDDYSAAADVPAALENLAETVDDLLTGIDTKALTAQSAASVADAKAVSAAAAVATHTHDGASSPNLAIAAVTGLNSALAGKADSGHTHPIYAAVDHSHTAQEISAHTHTEYAVTGHTHTQAQSHGSPDTDTAATALHHTLGTGANQAAPGNHSHSGFANASHTHTEYATSSHNHDTTYSKVGHNHSEYAPSDHTHSLYSTTAHRHTGESLALATLSVSGAAVDLPGVYSNATTGLDSVGITSGGRLRRLASSQHLKYDIGTISGELSSTVSDSRQVETTTVNPVDVLNLAVTEFSIIDDGKPTDQRSLGFIADDVADKFPIAATFYADGKTAAGVLDSVILAALLHIVREQQSRIEALEARLA